MRKLFNIAFLLLPLVLFSQHRADIWYFGQEAGLDFSTTNPTPVFDSKMTAESGCATICDVNGEVLFYTNGQRLWDRENNIMPDGDSISNTSFINQNSMVIPDPANMHRYYLFSMDSMSSGLRYSIIDMTENNGLGNIVSKNNPLTGYLNGKITAVNHCNAKAIWIVVHKSETPEFYSYLVSDTGGVSTEPVVSSCGSLILADIGMMKASPSGNRIAMPVNSSEILLEVYDFDNSTGIISNPKKIYKNQEVVYAYGVEFSGDGKYLYVSIGGQTYELIQYDLMSGSEEELDASAQKIASGNLYGMQIGPDNKIYIARVNDNYLSVINYPDRKGEACFFEERKIYLGDKICLMGLPNFNQSYFYFPSISFKNTCLGETTHLWFDISNTVDSIHWSIPSAGVDTRVLEYPYTIEKTFEVSGNYAVEMLAWHCGTVDTILTHISINRSPELNLGNDTTLFGGNQIVLDAGDDMDSYLWSTGDVDQEIIVWDTGIFWVQIEKNNCISSDSIRIEMNLADVLLPTAFSPNGDGVNELFQPKVIGSVSGFEMEIYNRFGQKVWQSHDLTVGWDGNYMGSNCPVDMYMWQMKFTRRVGENTEQLIKKGNVSLFR